MYGKVSGFIFESKHQYMSNLLKISSINRSTEPYLWLKKIVPQVSVSNHMSNLYM